MTTRRSLWLAAGMLAVALVMAAVAAARAGAPGDSAADLGVEVRTSDTALLWPPPDSLDAFADRMTTVVVGHYAGVIEVREAPRLQSAPAGPSGALPVTLMRFDVDKYLVGAGPDTIVIGQYGDIPGGYTLFGMPPPEFGTEITMVVTQWTLDPLISHPVFNAYGRLVERDGTVEYAFVTPELEVEFPLYGSLPFAAGLTLKEVQARLQGAARERGMLVPD